MQRFYLLVHHIPPRPLYLRAKVRQRLGDVGAVPIKNSVYVLPQTADTLEDFQWIAQEIVSGGGDAHVFDAAFVEPDALAAAVAQFNAARDADYDALAADVRAAMRSLRDGSEAARLATRLDEIRAIDFFSTPRRAVAEKALAKLQKRTKRGQKEEHPMRVQPQLRGKTWVTRPHVKVDRMASAWFVRRFIDPKARFRFVDPATPRLKGELRFDMVGGDYSHDGDRCTFETLVARVGMPDRGVKAIGEIVHDLDIKDDKYGRAEAAGMRTMIEGLIARYEDDNDRLERGYALFDDLHQALMSAPPKRRPPKK